MSVRRPRKPNPIGLFECEGSNLSEKQSCANQEKLLSELGAEGPKLLCVAAMRMSLPGRIMPVAYKPTHEANAALLRGAVVDQHETFDLAAKTFYPPAGQFRFVNSKTLSSASAKPHALIVSFPTSVSSHSMMSRGPFPPSKRHTAP
jgi:hypothetical protein